jgi:hypothetical protein
MSNIDKAGTVPAKKDGTPQIQIVRPEWLRLPKPGHRCPVSGLCRSYLHTLVRDGKVQTVSIRERGRKTGIRLIGYDSLMAFIAKQGDSGEQSKQEGGAQ